jgi:hypothetical protein
MSPTLALADRVAWLDMAEMVGAAEDVVYVSLLPDGPPLVLRSTAGLIFVTAVDGGTEDEIVDRVATFAELPADDLRPDVLTFLDHLVSLGLLTLTP